MGALLCSCSARYPAGRRFVDGLPFLLCTRMFHPLNLSGDSREQEPAADVSPRHVQPAWRLFDSPADHRCWRWVARAQSCRGWKRSSPRSAHGCPLTLFPSHADPQVAQIILAGIAASIMTVVSIVFAILLMTLTLASMQFSPRIIVSFSRDRVTQWTLGIFLGTFSYCMAALPAARSLPQPFAPVVDRSGRDGASAGLRRFAALFHSPHLAGHQRQSHRRPDRGRNRSHDRRNDAQAAPSCTA